MLIIILLFTRPIHGLIFLFKWVQDDEPSGSIVLDNRLDKIFFAKQVFFIVITKYYSIVN